MGVCILVMSEVLQNVRVQKRQSAQNLAQVVACTAQESIHGMSRLGMGISPCLANAAWTSAHSSDEA